MVMKDNREKKLDLRRFRTIVDAYGTDSRKWPEEERDAALLLINDSSEALEIIEKAKQLDLLLDEVPMMEPSSALKLAVAEIPIKAPSMASKQDALFWQKILPLGAMWKTAMAAALAMVLGVVTAVATMEPVVSADNQTGWEDFSGLAFVPDMDQELSP
jgi:hypothetical protein